MRSYFVLCLLVSCSFALAQTNTPAPKASEQQVEITSDSGHFDGITSQMIYFGHVFVTDNSRAKLYCEKLTVDLPPAGGHPTNIVAEATETNLTMILFDAKGQTNYVITADKATYAYNVVNSVTNETVLLSGGKTMPRVEGPKLTMEGDPLLFDVGSKQFGTAPNTKNYRVKLAIPKTAGGTNASPFNFLK